MQQKRHGAKMGTLLAVLAVVVAGGTVALMLMDIPAPKVAIEKDLDAQALLAAKPQ